MRPTTVRCSRTYCGAPHRRSGFRQAYKAKVNAPVMTLVECKPAMPERHAEAAA
ncbi:hypothetical protein HGP28_15860 [Vibrio sp. SM6]|uniref:Uncharacterized protein n=1 Tax=Vibrio agarilyticus TaxID=2726741 RepID=A0A7X8TTI7_9VIBR|nr:hypothetical protein [Vibrio agarilyticus]NLS14356.1 hypothetical protein [Vibrio agarilyticus]